MSSPLVILPGDDHYLGITWAVSIALQMTCFAIAWVLQVDKVREGAGR